MVALLSGFLHTLVVAYRRGSRGWQPWLELPLFQGSVSALLALASGTLYQRLGGHFQPRDLPWTQLVPLVALFLLWFLLDHLLWIGSLLARGRGARAVASRRQITLVSLMVELLPLPFSVTLAVSWTLFGPLLQALLLASIVLVAAVVRWLALSMGRTEERVQAVSLLNKFGQALVMAQMREAELATLLYDYARQLVPDARFALVLLEPDGMTFRTLEASPEMQVRMTELMPLILPMLHDRPRGRLLSVLSETALQEEAERDPLQRPARGGVLLLPLLASEALLGVFVAEALRADAFTLDDGRTLSVLATQTAVALQNARHFRRERWRVRQLSTLAEVSRMVAAAPNLNNFLQAVVELVSTNFGYYHVQIYLTEPESGEIVYGAGSGAVGKALASHPARLHIGTDGVIGWVAGTGEPLLVPDVHLEPRYRPDSTRLLPDVKAELAVPLKIEAEVLGVLDVQSDCLGELDEEDVFTLTALADQIAVAIQDARLVAEQREAAWVTSALLQFSRALNPLFSLTDVANTVAELAPSLVGVEIAALYLWRPEERHLEGAAAHGLGPHGAATVQRTYLAPERLLPRGSLPRQSDPLPLERTAAAQALPGYILAEEGEGGGVLALPLLAQGGFVGILLLATTGAGRRLSKRRRMLALGIAQQAAVSIQGAMLYAAQQEEAALTADLLRVAEMIAGRSELHDVLDLVTRLTVTMTGVRHCIVYLWDGEGDRLKPAAAYGFSPEVEAAWRARPLAARDLGCLTLLWDATEPVLLGVQGHPLGCPALEVLFEGRMVGAMPLRAHDMFLGALMVDLPHPQPRLGNRLRAILVGITRQLSVALEHALVHDELLQNERRTQELALARQIQGALLPDRAPDVPGYDIAGYWRPAREVAGDFYDYLRLGQGRLAVTIADVADKGMGAALFMVLTRTALRESLWSEEDAGRALQRTNHIISDDVRGGMFLTLFVAILTPESGQVQAANAGHLPPLHYHAATDTLAMPIPRHLPLGILPDTHYASFEFHLAPGDALILMTDGVMDTINSEQAMLGLPRLTEIIYEHRRSDARHLLHTILDAALTHAAGEPFADDLTIAVVRRL